MRDYGCFPSQSICIHVQTQSIPSESPDRARDGTIETVCAYFQGQIDHNHVFQGWASEVWLRFSEWWRSGRIGKKMAGSASRNHSLHFSDVYPSRHKQWAADSSVWRASLPPYFFPTLPLPFLPSTSTYTSRQVPQCSLPPHPQIHQNPSKSIKIHQNPSKSIARAARRSFRELCRWFCPCITLTLQ